MTQKITPVSSGYEGLDYILGGGFFPGELTVIASRSGEGKTSFIENIMDRIRNKDNPSVLFFSAEGAKEYQEMRFASISTGIHLDKIRRNLIPLKDAERINEFAKKFTESNLIIDDTPAIEIDKLCEKAAKLKTEKDIKIIFIDYLGLITSKDEEKPYYERVHEVADRLKVLSRKLEIPVVVTAELAKGEKGADADLSLLRGSGSIEDTADVVILLDEKKRDETVRSTLVNVAKNRNGNTRSFYLNFLPETCSFVTEQVE